MPLITDGPAWHRRGWQTLKWATLAGLGIGFGVGVLSLLSGNTISVNGVAIAGWRGVWSVTLALALGGLGFGLIGYLVFSALGIAAGRSK